MAFPSAAGARLVAAAAGAVLCAWASPAPAASRLRPEARAARAEPKPPVPLRDFVSALKPLGEWILHPRWGRAWRPPGVAMGWRPYFHGRWVPTGQGWYWVSDEPWGWATYHFGRWSLDPLLGWIWLPERTWAPSWVAWRQGKGLVGWAPLGPEGKAFLPAFVFVNAERILEPAARAALTGLQAGRALGETRPIAPSPVSAPAALRRAARASPTAWSSPRRW